MFDLGLNVAKKSKVSVAKGGKIFVGRFCRLSDIPIIDVKLDEINLLPISVVLSRSSCVRKR